MNDTQGNDALYEELCGVSDLLRTAVKETQDERDGLDDDNPHRIIVGVKLQKLQDEHLDVLNELRAINPNMREEDKQDQAKYYAAMMDDDATDMAEYDALVREHRASLNGHTVEEVSSDDDDKEPGKEGQNKVNIPALIVTVIFGTLALTFIISNILKILYP